MLVSDKKAAKVCSESQVSIANVSDQLHNSVVSMTQNLITVLEDYMSKRGI